MGKVDLEVLRQKNDERAAKLLKELRGKEENIKREEFANIVEDLFYTKNEKYRKKLLDLFEENLEKIKKGHEKAGNEKYYYAMVLCELAKADNEIFREYLNMVNELSEISTALVEEFIKDVYHSVTTFPPYIKMVMNAMLLKDPMEKRKKARVAIEEYKKYTKDGIKEKIQVMNAEEVKKFVELAKYFKERKLIDDYLKFVSAIEDRSIVAKIISLLYGVREKYRKENFKRFFKDICKNSWIINKAYQNLFDEEAEEVAINLLKTYLEDD